MPKYMHITPIKQQQNLKPRKPNHKEGLTGHHRTQGYWAAGAPGFDL